MRKRILYLLTFILLIAFFATLPTNVNAADVKFEYELVNLSIPKFVKATSARIFTDYLDVVTGRQIATSTSQVYAVGDTYTTSPITISGYVLEVTPSNAAGIVRQSNDHVKYEYRKQLTVTTKYVDKTTGTQISQTNRTYAQGADYTTERKNISGYTFVEDTGNTSGTVGDTNIEVIYYYKKSTGKVLTRYLDVVTGGEIASANTQTGLEGEAYQAPVAEVDRYVLEVTPDNATGTYSSGQIVVTYKYRKKSYVTTVYKDIVNNKEIYDRNVQDLKQGDNYTTTAKFVTGYTQVSDSGNTTGNVGAADITVTYNYKKNSEAVRTRFVDVVTGKEIADFEVQTGLEGEDYTTSPKDVNNYVLEITPENANGKFATSEIEVVYKYRKNLNVVTRYVDAVSGEDIIDPVTEKVLEERIYQTDGSKTFEGYTKTGDSGNTSGTVGPNNIEVIYYYKKNSNPVYTKFVDVCSKAEIATKTSQTGLEGENYTTAPITIDGYVLEVTPENANGQFATEDIDVVYEYRKQVNVITKFVDEVDGTEIYKAEEKTYLQEDEYTTEPMEFEGYSLTNDSGNTAGEVGPDTITVTYYYKKHSAFVYTNHIDVSTKETIAESTTQSGLESLPYETEPIVIDGYVLEVTPDNATGNFTVEEINVNYEYRKQSDVITKHVDVNSGEEIAEADVTTYLEGDSYSTAAVNVAGYVLTNTPDNHQGTVEREDVEVTYEYKKISQGIIVKYVDKVNNTILDTKVYEGNERDSVDLIQQEFDGYTLTERPDIDVAEMTVDVQEFVFYYYQNVSVLVNGIDKDSRKVLWEYTIEGVEADEYTTEPRDVEGYTLVKTPNNANGVHARTNTVIYYEYEKNVLLGDVNLDGYVNALDAAYILDRYKNNDATNLDYLYGDMNGDGVLNSTDAAMVLDAYKNS